MPPERKRGAESPLAQRLDEASRQHRGAIPQDQFLALALELADLSLQSLKTAASPDERARLGRTCTALLDEAERAKRTPASTPLSFDRLSTLLSTPEPTVVSKRPASSRALPKSEEILLWKGSKLHGNIFPPWQADPPPSEFEGLAFRDESPIPLSPEQQAMLDAWERPARAMPPPNWSLAFPTIALGPRTTPLMKSGILEPDLVQDAAPDCSVVASLCAGIARGRRGHSKILASVIWPYSLDELHPVESANGKYVMKLNFNGCFRKVVIDDRLPVSKTPRMLHVVDRNTPTLLWPALLEKAYLKVRGGYDFPGSNSGTDIWVLLGWIPEQIFLQHEDTDENVVWKRLKAGHEHGHVLITLGTGTTDPSVEENLGLAGDHDYAVLDLLEHHDQRFLLVKNPWLKSTVWTGRVVLFDDAGEPLPSTDGILRPPGPGSFWIPFSTVMVNYQTLYLNWDPALFPHRQDLHFSWDLTKPRTPPLSFVSNPQYTVSSRSPTTLWLLLSRHFTDRPASGAPAADTPSHLPNAPSDEATFISLYAFASQSSRVYTSRGAQINTPFVDAPQTLLKLDLPANTPYTIVPEEEHLPALQHTFTLSTFSTAPISIAPAPPPHARRLTATGAWTPSTAGGPATAPSYSTNPQYRLLLPTPARVTLFLQTLATGAASTRPQPSPSMLPIHVTLAHSAGTRLPALPRRAVAASSGAYAYGAALAATPASLPAGPYTIVVSTFRPGQLGAFELCVDADAPGASLSPLPREGAGRFPLRAAATFAPGDAALRARLRVARLSTAAFVATSKREVAPSALRVSVVAGRGPDAQRLVVSGEGAFGDAGAGGVRTGDVELRVEVAEGVGLWMVLERVGGGKEEVDVGGWCDREGLGMEEWEVLEGM